MFGAGRGRPGRGHWHGTSVYVRFAAGPDDIGGPGFGAGRGKRDGEMKAGERPGCDSRESSGGVDEADEGYEGSTSDGLGQDSSDEEEEDTDSVASSMSDDAKSESDDGRP